MNNETYWIVWAMQRGLPSVRHPDQESARREAIRLAEKHPGVEFDIFQRVGCAVAPTRPVTWWMIGGDGEWPSSTPR